MHCLPRYIVPMRRCSRVLTRSTRWGCKYPIRYCLHKLTQLEGLRMMQKCLLLPSSPQRLSCLFLTEGMWEFADGHCRICSLKKDTSHGERHSASTTSRYVLHAGYALHVWRLLCCLCISLSSVPRPWPCTAGIVSYGSGLEEIDIIYQPLIR